MQNQFLVDYVQEWYYSAIKNVHKKLSKGWATRPDFSGGRVGSVAIDGADVTSKVLKVVVPEGGANAAQQAVISRVATQAASQGVKVVVVPFR